MLKIKDSNQKMIIMAPLTKNKIFKIEVEFTEHKCLSVAINRDAKIWPYRLGHLNFRDLCSSWTHILSNNSSFGKAQ